MGDELKLLPIHKNEAKIHQDEKHEARNRRTKRRREHHHATDHGNDARPSRNGGGIKNGSRKYTDRSGRVASTSHTTQGFPNAVFAGDHGRRDTSHVRGS